MTEAKNVDDVIVASMNAQAPVQPIPNVSNPDPAPPVETKPEESIYLKSDDSHNLTPEIEEKAQTPKEITDTKESKDQSIDEYGNPIEKPKMYTEEELQNKIRERVARIKSNDNQPTPQQINQDAKGFTADPNSDQSWEVQLEEFIEKTIEKRQSKMSEKQWKAQQDAMQAEFEDKFNSGMQKYSDFKKVVSGKSITDSMMMATRSLENPAAFIYGASKLHAQELDRIARIQDPYAQAAEIGRLHEKMVKNRKTVSSAPDPIVPVKGDLPPKTYTPPPIDQRIHEYAKQKRR